MAFPVFHEYDTDGTIRTNRLHSEGFPHLAWEALSAAGYTTPLTYEVFELERLGVSRCRVIVTVLPHPDHGDWFDLSFIWGFRGHESVESAALRVRTDFCDNNPTVVALSPFGLFPPVSPHDPARLDCMDHLRELLMLAEPLDRMDPLASRHRALCRPSRAECSVPSISLSAKAANLVVELSKDGLGLGLGLDEIRRELNSIALFTILKFHFVYIYEYYWIKIQNK
jgi:hypothetical protein